VNKAECLIADIKSLRITVEVDVVLVRSNNMMKRTRRIYSGLTWQVTSLQQGNEKRNA